METKLVTVCRTIYTRAVVRVPVDASKTVIEEGLVSYWWGRSDYDWEDECNLENLPDGWAEVREGSVESKVGGVSSIALCSYTLVAVAGM